MGVILALVKMLGVNLLDLKRGVMWDGRPANKNSNRFDCTPGCQKLVLRQLVSRRSVNGLVVRIQPFQG